MPSQPAISLSAIEQVYARLSNAQSGFTPRLTVAMSDRGITLPNGWKLPINFAMDGSSKNFFLADVTPEDLDQTTAATYPIMTMYSDGSANSNLEKFRTFAGPITICIAFHATWRAGKVLPDFEKIGGCVELALYQTFNHPDIAEWATGANQGLVYDGQMSVRPSKLKRAGENWLQSYDAAILLESSIA